MTAETIEPPLTVISPILTPTNGTKSATVADTPFQLQKLNAEVLRFIVPVK